jgi:hypothetical protein
MAYYERPLQYSEAPVFFFLSASTRLLPLSLALSSLYFPRAIPQIVGRSEFWEAIGGEQDEDAGSVGMLHQQQQQELAICDESVSSR